MASSSALVVPIFIWHAPPSHAVTTSYLSLEHGRFITASDKGHIVLWKFSLKNEEKKLEPQVMCFTQEAVAISALEIAPYNERECLISISEAGSLFIWSLTDGQCQMARNNVFKSTPTAIKLLPDRRHIAVAGHSPTVDILDLWTMKIVRRMGPHYDWLCAIDWTMHSKQPMLVSVSHDNLFRMWMLDDDLRQAQADTFMGGNVPREDFLAIATIPLTEDKSATHGKPRQAFVSPSGSALLIVHEHHVSVFPLPITNMTPAWSIHSPQSIISACWSDDLTVLIFNALGQGFLHRLPRSVLPLAIQTQTSTAYSSMLFGTHGHSASAIDKTTESLSPAAASAPQSLLNKRNVIREAGQLHDIFKLPSSWKPNLTTPNGTLLAELIVPETIRRTFAVTEIHPGCVDHVVYLIHGNGQVIIWELPATWDRESVQSQIKPSFEARLSEGWATRAPGVSSSSSSTSLSKSSTSLPVLNLSSFSIPSSVDSSVLAEQGSSTRPDLTLSRTNSTYVTASMVLEKRLQLISGYSDGTIMMSKLPLDLNPRSWRAHHSRINTLLLIPGDNNKEFLVCGSSDFYITVWDLESEPPVLVHTFANHCGPVRSLFAPDPQDVRRRGWKYRFFSVGEDRTVGLFGVDRTPHCVRVFPNHPAAIQEVRWRPDEDYLLVQCKDGSVSVWEIESGTLESSVRGKEAEVVMSFAKPLSNGEAGSALKPVSRQSITGVSIPIEGESPVQAVLLNVKFLSQDLAEHLQAYDQLRQIQQAKSRSSLSPRSSLGSSSSSVGQPLSQSSSSIPSEHSTPVKEPVAASSATLTTLKTTVPRKNSFERSTPGNADAPKSVRMARNTSRPGLKSSSSKDLTKTPTKEVSTPPIKELSKSSSIKDNLPPGVDLSSTSLSASSQDILQGVVSGINPRMSLFLSAAQLGFYRACAYLLPWGLDQDLDQLVIAQLYLKPPKPQVSYGMIGVEGNMSVLVPRASELAGRWQCSDSLTSIHSLASVSIAKCLLAFDVSESLYSHETRNASSHLMSYFCVFLPEKVVNYIQPALAVLAAFWHDPLEDISQASRAIFSSVLSRLTHEQRRLVAVGWGNLLSRNSSAAASPNRADPSTRTPVNTYLRNQSVLVLSIIGCEYPESLTPEMASTVALELLEIVFDSSNSRMRIAAAELFGKGFQLWSQHLHEETSLIHRLFKLAMVSEPKNLSKTASRTLMLIAEKIPSRFTQSILQRFSDLVKSGTAVGTTSISSPGGLVASTSSGSLASSSSDGSGPYPPTSPSSTSFAGGALQGILVSSSDGTTPLASPTPPQTSAYGQALKEHAKVLLILARVVKTHRVLFYPELPVLVEAIVKAINPHITGLRENTLGAATLLLNMLVSLYPMIAIELTEQRLAVGTRDGHVQVYDLSSATRVHSLECHTPYSVSAVSFAGANKTLSSYSMETGHMKIWKTTQSLFGIFSGEPQCIKQYDIACSVAVPSMNLANAPPTVNVIKLGNLAIMEAPSSKTMKDLKQKKLDRLAGKDSPQKTRPDDSSNESSLSTATILEGLKFSWPKPKLIRLERTWEDKALSVLELPL